MSAMNAAIYYMFGCYWLIFACALTAVSPRPWAWLELAGAYAVVFPLLQAWRYEA